jgi:hypothetical protein
MNYRISSNLLTEAFRWHSSSSTKELVIDALEYFLLSVAVFGHVRSSVGEQDSKETSTYKDCVTKHCQEVKKWLGYNSYGAMKESLQVSTTNIGIYKYNHIRIIFWVVKH